MAARGKGPVDRVLPRRDGPEGKVASALGRILTATTQAGPIKYLTQTKHEFTTMSYLALKVQAPQSVKAVINPLLQDGAKVVYGSTHEDLSGWNLVADVSVNRDHAMALPQRIDQVATCLQKEQIDCKKTVFLALLTSQKAGEVTAKTAQTVLEMMRQVTRSADLFHFVFVFVKSPESLAAWDSAKAVQSIKAAATPRAEAGGKGGRAAGKGAKGGKGGKGSKFAEPAPAQRQHKGGRGGGAKARPQAVVETKQVGRVAGSGGKGGKGGKATTNLGGGVTQRVTKAGNLTFNRYTPY